MDLDPSIGEPFQVIWAAGAASFSHGASQHAWVYVNAALNMLPEASLTAAGLLKRRVVDRACALKKAFQALPVDELGSSSTVAFVINRLRSIFFEDLPQSLTLGPGDEAVIKLAFELTEYQDSGTVDEFMTRLNLFCQTWTSEKDFYAPYLALINASMTGKSRLLSEVCRNRGVFAFLMCLRPDKSKCYRPPRTEKIADWAKSENKDLLKFTHESCVLLWRCLKKLNSWLRERVKGDKHLKLKRLAREWDQHMEETSDEFWSDVYSKMVTTPFPEVPVTADVEPITELTRAKTLIACWQLELKKVKSKINAKLVQLLGAEKAKAARVLFVVDEARQLKIDHDSGGFALFRRALQAIPFNEEEEGVQMFCVVTDTTSRVSNLAPIGEMDPSARVAADGQGLYPPFTVVNTIDVWWEKAKTVRVTKGAGPERVLYQVRNQLTKGVLRDEAQDPQPGEDTVSLSEALTLELLESYEFKALFGRAGLYAHLVGTNAPPVSGRGPGVLSGLLKAKLLCEVPQRPDQNGKTFRRPLDDEDEQNICDRINFRRENTTEKYTETQIIGTLGAIASIQVSASSRLATEVSAGHMRLLAAISKLRKYVFTFEVSEPVLAGSAHRLICKQLGWSTVISKLVSTQLNHSTQSGTRGEVAFQLLSLMAWQVCLGKMKSLRFPAVPVVEFLERLFGRKLLSVSEESARAWKTMKTQLVHAYVDVNQFVSTQAEPSTRMLFEYFIRGSAIVCKKNQVAIDSVIPIYHAVAPSLLEHQTHISNQVLADSVQERSGSASVAINSSGGKVTVCDDKGALVVESRMSALVVQVKDHSTMLGSAEKRRILDKLDTLSFLSKTLSSVFLCLEFDSRTGDEYYVNDFNSSQIDEPELEDDPRLIRPLVVRTQSIREVGHTHDRFVIFARRINPSDILLERKDADEIDAAFNRLISQDFKIDENLNIDAMDRAQLKKMCKTQPLFNLA